MTKLTCYGGAGSATGANFLLEIDNKKILVDCGLEQGTRSEEHNRRKFEYNPAEINYLFVTHAHIDHTGLIPRLYREGFRGEIFSTIETKEIAELLLIDAVKINGDMPLYGLNDVSGALSLWKTLKYHEPRDFEGFTLELFNAGHVLGSASFRLTTDKGSMLFSGDIGNSPSPILSDFEKVSGLKYLLMESVYGDKNHESKKDRDEKFKRIVENSIKMGGTLLLPAFSLERTQVILHELDKLFENGVESVPVYLDSPLGIRITAIYKRIKNLYGEDSKFKELRETVKIQDSKEIAKTPGSKIIIAGSGMSTAGRILNHEEIFLPDPNSTILIIGYQAAGTLGRQIEEGIKKLMINEREVAVRARVEKIEGFSAHADSDTLVDFVSTSAETLKRVFVAMGEPKSAVFLTQRLRDELEVDAVVAEKGRVYEVDL